MYLGSAGIPGVGPTIAKRIVAAFGLATPRILAEEPERLVDVQGVGKTRIATIRARWTEDAEGRALVVKLRGLGLSPRVVERIRKRYGERAAAVVGREPYRLAEEIAGIGFRTADALAREQGLAADDPARLRAAALHALDNAVSDGHCTLPRSELHAAVARLAFRRVVSTRRSRPPNGMPGWSSSRPRPGSRRRSTPPTACGPSASGSPRRGWRRPCSSGSARVRPS